MDSQDFFGIESAAERKSRLVDEDIKKIDEAMKSSDEKIVKSTHIKIDGKYQTCIKDWMKGMNSFHPEHGFVYEYLDIDDMKENLEIMKPKLEAYKEGWNENIVEDNAKSDLSVVFNNNNNISISVSFEEARKKIEDMPGLTDEETEEIQNEINKLEEISKENISKKKKWEKIKPILTFVLDKGADVAITIMGIILQMKLGM